MRKQLICARKAAGLTQQQLADKVGVDRSYIAHLEHANKNPSLETAISIANILKMPVEEIFLITHVSKGHTGTTG